MTPATLPRARGACDLSVVGFGLLRGKWRVANSQLAKSPGEPVYLVARAWTARVRGMDVESESEFAIWRAPRKIGRG